MDIKNSKELIFDLDNMDWSFSRLNSFYNCPKQWYMNYILHYPKKNNFFSEYGSYIHGIMEKYNKNELEIFQLLDYYCENYDKNIVEQAPYNKFIDLNVLYYQKGYNFFDNFEEEKDVTIGAEVPFDFVITAFGKKRKILGFIDRVSKDNDGYIITDYKSKSKFKNKKEFKNYARQLYIYSIACKKIYGEYPKKLVFYHFKDNKKTIFDFKYEDMLETVLWIKDTIKNIYEEKEFVENYSDFYCKNLCNIGFDKCSSI